MLLFLDEITVIRFFFFFFSAKILHISKYPITFAPHLRKNNTLR